MAKKVVTKNAPKASPAARVKSPVMRDEMWPIEKIRPYAKNARTHPAEQITLLAELMKKHGPDQRIVVDEKGVIIKGHGRRLAALAAGMDEYPVVVRSGLTEAEKSAMRIADNQVSLLAGWDKDILRGEITRLKTNGEDITLLGFGEIQLVQFLTEPKAPGEFPAVDESLPVTHQCPKCGFRFSGGK